MPIAIINFEMHVKFFCPFHKDKSCVKNDFPSPACFLCACLLVTKYSLEADDGRLVADNNRLSHANVAGNISLPMNVW